MDNQPTNGTPQPTPQPIVPVQQVAPNPIVTNPGVPAGPAAPVQQPVTPVVPARSDLFVLLVILCALFCIPAAFGVKVYHDKYKAAIQAGDTVSAQKHLTTMKLWGFIGPVVGVLAIIAKIAGGAQ